MKKNFETFKENYKVVCHLMENYLFQEGQYKSRLVQFL